MIDSVFRESETWANNKGLTLFSETNADSTNDWAKREANSVSDIAIFIADEQTAGRGRGDNKWSQSAKGEALLISFVFKVASPPQPISTPCFGLALFRSVKATWPSLEWSLKAPNDLFLGGKKAAGILLETIQAGDSIHLIVGLGMNVLGHPDSEKQATHINGEDGLGSELSSEKWLTFLDNLLSHFSLASQSALRPELEQSDREEIMEALNKNSASDGPIIEVTENGDLVYNDRTISWKDL